MKDVNPNTRKAHLGFIQSNWNLLATLAYRGYLDNGKGMLFLQDDPFIGQPAGKLIPFGAVYVSEGSPEFSRAGGKWPGEKECLWVSTYDAHKTVLICFVRNDGGQSSYRIDGLFGNLPVDCYQRTQEKDN